MRQLPYFKGPGGKVFDIHPGSVNVSEFISNSIIYEGDNHRNASLQQEYGCIMTNQKQHALLCPNCRKLISQEEKKCPYCGMSNPGSGFNRLLALKGFDRPETFVKTIIGINIAMYIISLFINPSKSGMNFNPLTMLSPSSKQSAATWGHGQAAHCRLSSLVDPGDRQLHPRRSSPYHFQYDGLQADLSPGDQGIRALPNHGDLYAKRCHRILYFIFSRRYPYNRRFSRHIWFDGRLDLLRKKPRRSIRSGHLQTGGRMGFGYVFFRIDGAGHQ